MKDKTVCKTVKTRDFSKFCTVRFNNDLAGVKWDNNIINSQNDVNKMLSIRINNTPRPDTGKTLEYT